MRTTPSPDPLNKRILHMKNDNVTLKYLSILLKEKFVRSSLSDERAHKSREREELSYA